MTLAELVVSLNDEQAEAMLSFLDHENGSTALADRIRVLREAIAAVRSAEKPKRGRPVGSRTKKKEAQQ